MFLVRFGCFLLQTIIFIGIFHSMNYNIFLIRFPVVAGILLLLCSCVTTRQEQDGLTVIRDMPETELYTADIQYPAFDGEPELNDLIKTVVDGWFYDFVTEAELNGAVYDAAGIVPVYEFIVTWDITLKTDTVISVLLEGYQYTGGANGRNLLTSFVWDTADQRIVLLDELLPRLVFPPETDVLASECAGKLREKLIVGDGQDNFLEQMIVDGTAPIPENYRIYTVSEDGVTIHFVKYQVAPGSYGNQQVFIPFIS